MVSDQILNRTGCAVKVLYTLVSALSTIVDITCTRKFSDNLSLQNEELISASESGDVMTVVSLLNSGADVQTENVVYIFLVTCRHL